MATRRQHLVDTAYRLFNEHGYHATGIDWILAESGVSKATLYKHFRSKELLILEVLQQRHERLIKQMKNLADTAREQGKDPINALFDGLDIWFRSENFYGCNFINASAEYSCLSDDIHQMAKKHKLALQKLIASYLDEPNKQKRVAKAAEIALLMDGAIVYAQTRGKKEAARIAQRIARQLS